MDPCPPKAYALQGASEKKGCLMNPMEIKNTETIVPAAIDYYLGNIANLPEAAQIKIRHTYEVFYCAYHLQFG